MSQTGARDVPAGPARRLPPPISLQHIRLTELINTPSPVTPKPEDFKYPFETTPLAITKKKMSIAAILTEDIVLSSKPLKLIFDEPVTPVHTPVSQAENPLPPLRHTTLSSPVLQPLQPPISRKRKLEDDTPEYENKKRKYVCKICDFGFHQAGGLRNHTNAVHLKQKPFACSWPGCLRYGERGFAARGDLTRHISSVHRGERKFQCGQCEMRFARRSVLVRHLRNIHKVDVPGRRDGGEGGSGSGSGSGSASLCGSASGSASASGSC